jgi:hypothetical protein
MKERRYKIAALRETDLLDCLIQNAASPNDVVVKVSLDVPPGTVVVGRTYNHSSMAEEVCLYNPQWPIIPQADILPRIEVKTTYIQVKASSPQPKRSQPLALKSIDGKEYIFYEGQWKLAAEVCLDDGSKHLIPAEFVELLPAPKSNFPYSNEAWEKLGFSKMVYTMDIDHASPGSYSGIQQIVAPKSTLTDARAVRRPCCNFPSCGHQECREAHEANLAEIAPTPKSKIEDPFMKIWEEKGGLD